MSDLLKHALEVIQWQQLIIELMDWQRKLALWSPPAEAPFNYDAWLADRNERAHREFMERTSRLLPCDLRLIPAKRIDAYLGALQ